MALAHGDDFSKVPVPDEFVRPWYRIFSVWVGFIVVIGVMAVGGGLAAGMSLPQLSIAVITGNFLLGLLAAISGFVAADSRKSFAQLCEGTFGGRSAKIVILYAPLTLVAWYSIECAIFGAVLGNIFHLTPDGTRLAMAGSALLFCTTTYFGFRGMQWISFVLVPAMVVLGGLALFYMFGAGAGRFGFGPSPISLSDGIGLVIGSWALGVVAAYPDIARFAKNRWTAVTLGFFGILIFNSLNFILGAGGAAYAQQYNPALILLAAGLPVFAVILGIANVWTTNDANLYSASLGITNILPLSRRASVLLCAAISLVLAYFNPARFTIFFGFLGVLSATAPALGGVVFGAYLTRKWLPGSSASAAWIGWLAGALAGHFVKGMWSVPAGFAVGYIVWAIVHAATRSSARAEEAGP